MNKNERYEKAVEGLSQTIFHLTWLGHFWGFGGAIVLDEIRSWYKIHRLGENVANTLSARSSTYYAAAGNAKAHADKSFFAKPLWLALAVLCFFRSKTLSDRFEKIRGMANMTANELEQRSSVLRRAGKNFEALKRIEFALDKPGISANTRVLLLIGEAECWTKLHERDTAMAEGAYYKAFKYRNEIPASTHVRLLRSRAGYVKTLGHNLEADDLLFEAKLLAEKDALSDQISKIEAAQ